LHFLCNYVINEQGGFAMQNAKIFLVEDDPEIIRILKKFFELTSHKITLQAGTLNEALTILHDSQWINNAINVAIVDGNFPTHYAGKLNPTGLL